MTYFLTFVAGVVVGWILKGLRNGEWKPKHGQADRGPSKRR